MTIRNRLSAAMPFAQLLGFHPRADEGDDEDKTKRAKGEGDDPDKDDDAQGQKGKGKKAADDNDDDKDAKGAKGEGDDPDKDDTKGRKAKRADDDSDDPDAEDDDETQAIVSQERARCAAIVAHGFKAGSPEQACVFAFDTGMSADAAISAINAAGAVGGKGGSFKDRMDAAKIKNVESDGGDDLPAGVTPVAQQIIAAAARAQPQSR
ncbi:hypothetical protein [Pseudomonas sp. OV226]|uniref:hypothetical protein n=1 Tax=Pseudomonas sp. OV226 TaxID=2135588 RepID=UPI000D795173|nr:hypothetical protein [Pseudomonas sp. OV226]PWK30863.1 hypothetical protein C7534_12522 [Pseudomonas sp. OV226]